jgi:hypothetical protein
MRLLYLTSVAAAAWAVSLGAAHAQGMNSRSDERPAAAESRQQPQRGEDAARSRRPAAAEQRSKKGWNQRASESERNQRSTTGTSQGQTERPSAAEPSSPQRRATESEPTRSRASERPRGNAERSGRDAERDSSRQEQRGRAARDRNRTGSEDAQRNGDRTTGQTSQRDGTSASAPAQRSRSTGERSQQRRDQAAGRDRSERDELRLSEQQRSRVTATFSERIDRMNVRPLSRSNISVSIGATIPGSVHVYDVPSDIVRIYPRFRGHKFVVVEDEIVIIAPDRRRVVATLPMSGSRAMARSSTRSTTGSAPARDRVRLSPQEETVVRTTILREPACRFEQRVDFFIGIPLPRTVRVCEFPEEVLAEVPEFRRYRYITRGDEIVVVDPDEYEVVDVIR